MNECINLEVYSNNNGEIKEVIRVNHGFEILKPCNFKYFITNVSITKQKQIINKCNDRDLENCSDGIIYKAEYKIVNPLVNWKIKRNFNLNLPNGSVMTYVGDKTLCNKKIENKYMATKIIERETFITKEDYNDFTNLGNDGFLLKSKEDVKIGLFKGKRYIREKEYISSDILFKSIGISIDRFNVVKTIEETEIVYDENPNEFNFKEIIRYLINNLTI